MDRDRDRDRPAGTSGESVLAVEIRRRRVAAGWSQAELAVRVGYSREYVSRAERPGRGLISANLVRALDVALDTGGTLAALREEAHRDRVGRRTSSTAGLTRVVPAADAASVGDITAALVARGKMSDRARGGVAEDAGGVTLGRAEFLRLVVAAVGAAVVVDNPQDLAGHAAQTAGTRLAGLGQGWVARTDEAVLSPSETAREWDRKGRPGQEVALRPLVDQVMDASLGADQRAVEAVLPDLIGRVEWATVMAPSDPALQAVLSDVYAVAAWVLIKADRALGAGLAADRAVAAAQHAQDRPRIAAATRCRAEVYLRGGDYERAIRSALLATVELGHCGARKGAAAEDERVVLSLRGAALLSAAAAAARCGEAGEATRLLEGAAACARELGEDRHDLASMFGPTNVAIHRVAIPVELGDPRAALRAAAMIDVERVPAMYAERRARLLLDVARAHLAVGEFGAATEAVLAAERCSGDEVARHRITRRLVPLLMAHERRNEGLRSLGRRCGAIA